MREALRLLLGALGLVLMGGGAALGGAVPGVEGWSSAAERRQTQRAWISRHDVDGDGALAMDESPLDKKGFHRRDRDRDGQISAEEAPARSPRELVYKDLYADWVESQDADGDGRLEEGEFLGGRIKFRQLDRDRSGHLGRPEAEFLEGLLPGGVLRDRDGDGVMSADEFQGPRWWFRNIDVNRDGVVGLVDRAASTDGESAEDGFYEGE